ncbi:2'-deoxycytidine 5'-triphosphate deaminase [Maricaulis parjimensis]|uniref:2'-deoxycytidine 5'-triphosphate deaminase n=1 Tax=Maricaulis parjimensis TaxID=144023 RepID=UPI001939E736|nr:2'-deoxycytidine 5'-triphosphate deaminase [Maricaulis parjimensis]
MSANGILPDTRLTALFESGVITAERPPADGQIQPASVDLRLGGTAYRLRASFLPGRSRTVSECLDSDLKMHTVDLSQGAVLETGCVYLAPLQERLKLPAGVTAMMNPKSSTGRIDVFTRVITDHGEAFDRAPEGYDGPLYAEISPCTFSILVHEGDRLSQVRFRQGVHTPLRDITVSVDLSGFEDGIVGYRARRHAGLVDLSKIGAHPAARFWEPLYAPDKRLILDPGEFYILASREAVTIGCDEAAEMAPIATEIGEFRAHYAGFFDPGFGTDEAGGTGSRAVLEVRGHDVPFILEHSQAIARLVYEPMAEPPGRAYGQVSSNYQKQGLKLSKFFV